MFKFLHMDRVSKGKARAEKFRRGLFPFSFLCLFLMKKYTGYQTYFLALFLACVRRKPKTDKICRNSVGQLELDF